MDESTGLQYNIYNKEEKSQVSLREVSRMKFYHPYIAYCKGSMVVEIKNLHWTDEVMTFELEPSEIFVCFIDVDDNHTWYSEKEDSEKYPGCSEE
jgi:hypothetical protein